ncbi:MAG: hypothetical protein K2H29_06620 [Oscillospiraceae bacterium]|nr:hypothetical protein [Oscillospiraceae bacterium]
MYTVKRKTVFTKSIKDGAIQTCYLMHITVDTVADIPNAKENWLAGSRCDVLEDGGHVYELSNGREWVEVNFFDRVGGSDDTDLSNFYTKSQTDERITEKILDHLNNIGQFYLVDGEIKGEIFNDYAHNVASGQFSHSKGVYTTASGDYSYAEGAGTKASGNYAHSEGETTKASGDYSHAGGRFTEASGYVSYAEGIGTKATSSYSHAEGNSSTASGEASHADGYGTIASGINSHSSGCYTIAAGQYQFALGKYNTEDTDNKFAFIIGNGEFNRRHNGFSIDWNGNIYVNNSNTPVNVLDLLNRLSVLESKIAELENSENT